MQYLCFIALLLAQKRAWLEHFRVLKTFFFSHRHCWRPIGDCRYNGWNYLHFSHNARLQEMMVQHSLNICIPLNICIACLCHFSKCLSHLFNNNISVHWANDLLIVILLIANYLFIFCCITTLLRRQIHRLVS